MTVTLKGGSMGSAQGRAWRRWVVFVGVSGGVVALGLFWLLGSGDGCPGGGSRSALQASAQSGLTVTLSKHGITVGDAETDVHRAPHLIGQYLRSQEGSPALVRVVVDESVTWETVHDVLYLPFGEERQLLFEWQGNQGTTDSVMWDVVVRPLDEPVREVAVNWSLELGVTESLPTLDVRDYLGRRFGALEGAVSLDVMGAVPAWYVLSVTKGCAGARTGVVTLTPVVGRAPVQGAPFVNDQGEVPLGATLVSSEARESVSRVRVLSLVPLVTR